MEPVDLNQIYRLVSQRARRAKGKADESLALAAKEVARQLAEDPSITHLNAFRRAERRWLFCDGQRRNVVSLYSAFKSAIESGNFVNNRPVYRNNALGDDPEKGFVYCITSSDYPGFVKIGYTRNAPEQRLRQLRIRHQLSDAKLEYVMAADHPARIEAIAHKRLNIYRIANGEEWFERPVSTAAFVISYAAYLCNCNVEYVRTFGQRMLGQKSFEHRD